MLENYPQLNAGIGDEVKALRAAAPEMGAAFTALSKAVYADGALSAKHKKLIALGIAVSTRCEGCIAHYVHELKKFGATDAEVVDALQVAVLMGGGPSLMYAAEVLRGWRQVNEA